MHGRDDTQTSTGFVQFLEQNAQTPIAWTKLTIPQQGSIYLKRVRLIDMLHNMIDRKLVLVRAPAGYGKTSLLVDLANETDLQVCWHTIEAQNSDLGVFLTHLIATIARRFPAFGKRSARTLADMGGQIHTQLRVFAATFVDEILNQIPEYFFLILDDYHTLDESSSVHEFVRIFVDFMPEQCHLIIASRSVPPLPLIRLVARQQMAAIGVDELRFTEREIEDLVTGELGAALSADQIKLFAQQSDGWVTAILLSADIGWDALLRERDTPTDLTETSIYEYLVSEVFEEQPETVQRFLLRTSVLDEMTVSLCDELVGQDSHSILRTLDRSNLFISRVEQTGLETTYRYHPLFHDFLCARLRRQDEALYRELNGRVADSFEDRQDWHAAVTHNAKAGRYARIKDIVLLHYDELYQAGHYESLARWIDLLPPDQFSVRLQIKRAALANMLRQTDTALRLYTNAIAHFESQRNETDLAFALVERSYALSRSGSYAQAIADCKEALSLLSGAEDIDSLLGRCYHYLGLYHAEGGEPTSALGFLSLAHQHWTQCGESPTYMAQLAHTMSMAYGMQGDHRAAIEQCNRAFSLWSSLGNEPGMADALNNIGTAYHRLGEYQTAMETLQDALIKSRNAGAISVEAYSLASLGDLYRDLGQFAQALDFYEQAYERNQITGEAYLRAYLIHARAEALYLAGQIERAQSEIQHTLSQKTLSKPLEAQHRILLAATLLHQRENSRARQELESVLHEPSVQSEVAFRGHMQLAQAAMIENRPLESREHLHTAIQLAQEAGLTQPLCVESLNHIQVLEFVIEQEENGQELRKWMAAARDLEQTRKKLAKEQGLTSKPRYPSLQIDALGASRVLQDGQIVPWRTSQAKELFFYLLAHPDGQTKEQIGTTLWPIHSQARLSSIFRSSLFRVRKALYPEAILYEGEIYCLNPEASYQYDVAAFEESFSKAELADNLVQKAYYYRQAVALYKGEFLTDLYAEWISHFREALKARYLQALAFLAQFNLNNSNHPQAIEHARKILAVEKHHEGAYHVLIRAYARSGQRPNAKQIYEQYREMLSQFDLEPQMTWEDLCH
jgi:ATP/maltotriose-dependent transcriptional regulator MalT